MTASIFVAPGRQVKIVAILFSREALVQQAGRASEADLEELRLDLDQLRAL